MFHLTTYYKKPRPHLHLLVVRIKENPVEDHCVQGEYITSLQIKALKKFSMVNLA